MDRLKPLFFAISIFLPPCVSSAAIEEPKKNIGVSEVKYINTVLEIAKPTALAPIRVKNGVKLMALATNNGGEVVIQNAVIGFDHGSSFQPAPGAAVGLYAVLCGNASRHVGMAG
ncbi:MAG: hypothetical protein KJ049_05225, partial [Gammaproteobacteria bacterium]|nr:hypothetical protein [Gammaproteobacteria bacterium]